MSITASRFATRSKQLLMAINCPLSRCPRKRRSGSIAVVVTQHNCCAFRIARCIKLIAYNAKGTAMPEKTTLNENGNHRGELTLGVGGWAEYTVYMTETADTVRHDVGVPPAKVVPIIFLPGVMGSNLRMTVDRSKEIDRKEGDKRPDRRAWRPDDIGAVDTVMGSDIGNWFKNATPAQRQLEFDQNQTEVEYYHYTESKARFDPEGRKQSQPMRVTKTCPMIWRRFPLTRKRPARLLERR